MKMNQVSATLCQTRNCKPLVSVDLPGVGIDMTPQQLRALADALVRIAADAERQPMDKRYTCKKRQYALA